MKTKEERFKRDWFLSQMCRIGQEAHHGQFPALTAAEVISFLMVCLNSSEAGVSFERSSCYTCKAELRDKKPEHCAGPWVYNYLARETRGYACLVLCYDLQSSRSQMLCMYIQSYTPANIWSVHVCSHTHMERGGRLPDETHKHSQMRVFVGLWWEHPKVYSKDAVIGVGTIDWKSHPQRTLVMTVSKVMMRARRLACAGSLRMWVSIFGLQL